MGIYSQSNPVSLLFTAGTQWIGVPGELRGYEAIHKQYGKLPWAELFEPTIALAKDGFKIPTYLAKMLANPLAKHRVESTSLWYSLLLTILYLFVVCFSVKKSWSSPINP